MGIIHLLKVSILNETMNYPKVNYNTENSNYMESIYFCFLAKGITNQTYQNGNYYILPYLQKGNSSTVYFPSLKYTNDFWQKINNNPNIHFNSLYPKACIKEVQNLLSKKSEKYNSDKEGLIKDWKEIEKEYFNDIGNFLDFKSELAKIKEINVVLTPYGTRSSFWTPKKARDLSFWISSRIDFPAVTIGKTILNLLYILKTRTGGEIGEDKFIKRMEVVRFLTQDTILNKYFKSDKKENVISQKIISDSNNYLKKLGFPPIKIDLKSIDKVLTTQEKKVFSELHKAHSQVVTFDNIADVLWKDLVDEKFSLETIAKVIQNIRDKIKKQGINKEIIFTKRGKGYFLQN